MQVLADIAPSSLTGLVVVRGGGASVLWRRLPRRSSVGAGQGERNGLVLPAPWVPRDLVTLTPVDTGWVATNGRRAAMLVESDLLQGGRATFLAGGPAALVPGETRLSWPDLDAPVSLSVTVRTRRGDDQRVPFAVDGRLPGAHEPAAALGRGGGEGSYLGLSGTPMSLSLRYWLAVLFRHLLEDDSEPLDLVRKRAAYLGVGETQLEGAAHRYRRRLNVERDLQIGDLYELGLYLVRETGELSRDDLDP